MRVEGEGCMKGRHIKRKTPRRAAARAHDSEAIIKPSSVVEQIKPGEPIYAIPTDVLKKAERYAAEWELSWELESEFSAGLLARRWVGQRSIPFSCEYALWPLSSTNTGDWITIEAASDDGHQWQRRIVGSLLTCPEYLADVGSVRQFIASEPGMEEQLVWPLSCQAPLFPNYLSSHCADQFPYEFNGRLKQRLGEFFARWQLVAMCTWDLPVPNLPSEALTTPGFKTGGVGTLTLQLPTTLDFSGRGKKWLVDAISKTLQRTAVENQTPSIVSGAAAKRRAENTFWVAYLELAIRLRFASRKVPKGFEKTLGVVIAESTGLSEDDIAKRLKQLKAARKRASLIAELKPD